jgi:hypothetical protein
MTTRELLCRYENLGWAPVPVPAGRKRAVLKDWPNRRFGLVDASIRRLQPSDPASAVRLFGSAVSS